LQENEIVVSVGLVVYNHEKYLAQAIDSILMQEVNFAYELVIGDDMSTDNSRDVILAYKEKYPDKITLLFQEKNVGGTKNIYDIFMKARGKYVACLEADDYWIDAKKLQKQVDFLESNRDYLGVSHLIEARDMDGKYISTQPSSPKIIGKDATADLFLKGYHFSAVATVFRNIFLDKTSDYSIYYKAHKFVGDLTMCMILLDKGKIRVLNEALSAYRCRNIEGETNYNSIRNDLQKYSDHMQLLNAITIYFAGRYSFSREYIERSTFAFFSSIKRGDFKKFRCIFSTIPNKTKVHFYILLPFNFAKRIMKKIILLFKRNKKTD